MYCRRIFNILFLLVILGFARWATATAPGFQEKTILSGLTEPVHLTQLPDGRMLLLQKQGQILVFDPAEKPATTSIYLTINDIDFNGERGLTTLVLDPEFARNGYFYVYYAHSSSKRNRISRFTHQGAFADPASEVLIWQDNEDMEKCCHYGGGLDFGPDGKLYLTTGEEFRKRQSPDLTRAGGKIIRINRDGSIPSDNPFADGPGGNLDEVWAYGLRNPFRASWDDVTDRFFIGNVGSNDPQTAREEIEIGRAGANYGWPDCEGQCDIEGVTNPLYDYAHAGPKYHGGSVTAGFVYWGNLFPSQYTGAFFFADYSLSWIRYLLFNPDGTVASVKDFATDAGAPVHLIEAIDGSLYYVDYSGSVRQITYQDNNLPPVIDRVTVTPPSGSAPFTTTFSVGASDPENDSLSYKWWLGDGTTATGKSPTHIFTKNGPKEIYVQVSDGNRSTLSAPVLVQAGNPPAVTIDRPATKHLFRAGDIISFSGTATDPDETIDAANYVWDILAFDDAHIYPELRQHIGRSGELQINTGVYEGYRLTLTVTDSDGLQSSDSVTLRADTVNMTLVTDPAEIPVVLDGARHTTPFTTRPLIGSQSVLAVPESYCFDGERYYFSGWSDGGASTHQIKVPDVSETLTATFTRGGECNSPPTDGLVVHLEADAGVSFRGDRVTGWSDQSGLGNDLIASGDPRLVTGALNGRAVIDFDGSGDKLERTAFLNKLPARNADRTVYLLANYRGTGFGGFSYGMGAGPPQTCNQSFGTVVDRQGALAVQGWCNDFSALRQGTGAGWLIQSAVLESGRLNHYLDGQLIDTRTHEFDTVLTNMVVGAELDGRPFINMQVASILVYDHALSATEQAQVLAYLREKYFTPDNSGNQAPVANNDSASVPRGNSTVLAVLENDADPDGALALNSIVITTDPKNGSLTLDAVNGTLTYVHNNSLTIHDSFSYQVADDGGRTSNVATVNISVTGSSFIDVQSIFTARCAICHEGSRAPDLREGYAYSSIVGVPSSQVATLNYVQPGSPESSYLQHKIKGTQASVGGHGQQMPVTGGYLSPGEMDSIANWILSGARKAGSRAVKP